MDFWCGDDWDHKDMNRSNLWYRIWKEFGNMCACYNSKTCQQHLCQQWLVHKIVHNSLCSINRNRLLWICTWFLCLSPLLLQDLPFKLEEASLLSNHFTKKIIWPQTCESSMTLDPRGTLWCTWWCPNMPRTSTAQGPNGTDLRGFVWDPWDDVRISIQLAKINARIRTVLTP